MKERMFSLNDLYESANNMLRFGRLFGKIGKEQNFACKECGTNLKAVYLENENYMVVCPWCETIKLTRANKKAIALQQFGNYSGDDA